MDLYPVLKFLPFKRFRQPPPRVALLRLAGVIGSLGPMRHGLTLDALDDMIERAFAVPRLAAVALAINSPGGSPVQSALIAQRVRQLAKEKELKVLAFCEDVAASGGYWLALAGDEIFVEKNSIVGSIGVISSGFGFGRLIDKLGIERRLHTSGEKKSMLDPFQPEDPEDVSRLTAIQQEIHRNFKVWVKERRGARLKADDETLFSGEFWTGARAVELGLVDGEGTAHQLLRERYGDEVKIIPVKSREHWLKRRFGLSLPRFSSALEVPALSPGNWASDLLAAVEERAFWGRFGL